MSTLAEFDDDEDDGDGVAAVDVPEGEAHLSERKAEVVPKGTVIRGLLFSVWKSSHLKSKEANLWN